MSSTATINLSNSPKSPQIFQVGGNQSNSKAQIFHVANNQDSTYVYGGVQQSSNINMTGAKLAYPASNYSSDFDQYQPQQQFQMQQQYQPQYYPSQEYQSSHQPQYYQAQYQPQEQYQQQYQSLPPHQQHSIKMAHSQPPMMIQSRDIAKPPVFEAPIEKIQMVKKNQFPPPKSSVSNMQTSFRSSRSGSFAALEEITDPPHFIKHPESHQITSEGDPVSITARVTPAGDPNLTVQWYKDGNLLNAGSRFNSSFERGFAILDILYTFKEDSGEYSCVAKNNFGMDQTSPSILSIKSEENVILNSHLPREMTDNIAAMEEHLNRQNKFDTSPEKPIKPPQFIRQMPGLYNLHGGQSVHLETMVIPIDDSTLVIEWFKNRKPLNNGSRFNTIFDRGFAILDITGLIAEDSGDYFCFARNAAGQTQSTVVRLTVIDEENVVTKSQLPKESVQYLQSLDAHTEEDVQRSAFRYEEEEEPESLPHFDIKPVDLSVEDGSPAKFIVKVSGYPRPQIQWFMNDCLIVPTTTQKIYSDGSISYLEFQRCKTVGDSHIMVLARNKLGEAVANAALSVIPENYYLPELKRTDPENPFRKLATLKKVDISPELRDAFKKQKPSVIQINSAETIGLVKSKEALEAENLYSNVQSKLKRSDKLSYAGAPTGGQIQSSNYSFNQDYQQPALTKTSQFTVQIGNPTIGPQMAQSEMTFRLGN